MAEPLCSILVVDTPHPRYENATSDTAVYSVDVLSPASGSAVRALSLVQTAGAAPPWGGGRVYFLIEAGLGGWCLGAAADKQGCF